MIKKLIYYFLQGLLYIVPIAVTSYVAIWVIRSLENIIHPTINQENGDPDCDLNYVPNIKISKDVNYALSNSFGFGGQNACIVIKKY